MPPPSPSPPAWSRRSPLHPPSPVFTRLGRPRPFDPTAHVSFQAVLRAHGHPDAVAEKDCITRAVLAGEDPRRYCGAPSRAGRMAARVALRQMLHIQPENADLHRWLAVFDHGAPNATAAADVHA
ncbi:MAG: hypothetical protein U1E42_09695 [Rhodospirillales bacterium]